MSKIMTAPLCLLVFVACLLQGCDLVVTGVVTYDEAVSHQEHAAYTDYLFEAISRSEPVLAKPEWLRDVYRPRLAYADYYAEHTDPAVPMPAPVSYEVWKGKDDKWKSEDYQHYLFVSGKLRPKSKAK